MKSGDKMYYYALFLDGISYIEKCVCLMRFICRPTSLSMPHITLRLLSDLTNKGYEYEKRKFHYLNVIEPGTFNIESNHSPYVVFLKCESQELEALDHRPNFPRSRLHITIYEGNNLIFAKKLESLLSKYKWHFQIEFDTAKNLKRKVKGSKSRDIDIKKIFHDILGNGYQEFLLQKDDDNLKIFLMKKILDKLDEYVNRTDSKIKKVESLYLNSIKDNPNSFIDASYKGREDRNKSESYSVTNEKIIDTPIYVTPPEYARDMAECGLNALGDGSKIIDFGDSAVGTGALFLALINLIEEKNQSYDINTAIGIDINKDMARDAFLRYNKRGLDIIYGDALSSDLQLEPSRNLMLVNPPFNRHEDIPLNYRKMVKQFAEEQTGITVSGTSGLYVYHLLIMDRWLSEGGVAVWLLPSTFMQTKYGYAIKEYLLKKVQLLRLHIYSDDSKQFDNAQVSTTIVVFRKEPPQMGKNVLCSYGISLNECKYSKVVPLTQLNAIENSWRPLFAKNNYVKNTIDEILFEDVFDIKRGIATGANSFFTMERRIAEQKNIPGFALKPLLPKARFLKSLIVESQKDGYPDLESQPVVIDCDLDEKLIMKKYPMFYNYLQTAKTKDASGKSIIERTLVKGRVPWYKQEKRDSPTYLLTYMGRIKSKLPPLYFIWNKSNAIALNTYILLYPKGWLSDLLNKEPSLYQQILKSLNESAEVIVQQQTRIYAGGLRKIEPNELRKLPLINLPDKVLEKFKSL